MHLAEDRGSEGPRFKSNPRLTSQSFSSYQLSQLGSNAASESTLTSQINLKTVENAGHQIKYFIKVKFPYFPISNVPVSLTLGCLVYFSLYYLVEANHSFPTIFDLFPNQVFISDLIQPNKTTLITFPVV